MQPAYPFRIGRVPLKVLTVFGTRPEAVKLGPVIKELARHAEAVTSRVCVTAQHRDMLDQVLRVFDIQPDYDLDVMQANQTPTQVASTVLARRSASGTFFSHTSTCRATIA